MPFFKLKKSKKYNVVSKNSYVISVQLLDNTTFVECTLTADSTGQECLDRVCQRLEITEQQYFGLRYVSKKLKLRWIELDKPLQKILQKHAHESWLYFGVMYYVTDIQALHDEAARYQFYLQLKNDVIEGVLQCSPEQAILLASYSIQAELGDHDEEKHTTEHFKNFVLLPRHLTQDEDALFSLTEAVVNVHNNQQGMAPAVAETLYITEAQQLDGYGQECHPAKDEAGNDILLGASSTGVFVRHMDGQATVCFHWSDIVNMVHNKSSFGIMCSRTNKTINFQMEDAETAKYVWKLCALQHKFYMKNKPDIDLSKDSSQDSPRTVTPDSVALASMPSAHATTVSVEEEHNSDVLPAHQVSVYSAAGDDVTFDHAPELRLHERASYSHESYVDDNMPYPHNSMSNQYVGQLRCYGDTAFYEGQTQYHSQDHIQSKSQVYNHGFTEAYNPNIAVGDRTSLDQQIASHLLNGSAVNLDSQIVTVPYRVASTPNLVDNIAGETSKGTTLIIPVVPEYRKTPDYNVVMQHLQHDSSADVSAAFVHSETGAYSQSDVVYSQPTSTVLTDSRMSSDVYVSPAITYSTPELNVTASQPQHLLSVPLVNELEHYKPPPPYSRPSSSTPDLTLQLSRNKFYNSSPDLISRKYLPPHLVQSSPQVALDRTVENLADISNLEYNVPHLYNDVTPMRTFHNVNSNKMADVRPHSMYCDQSEGLAFSNVSRLGGSLPERKHASPHLHRQDLTPKQNANTATVVEVFETNLSTDVTDTATPAVNTSTISTESRIPKDPRRTELEEKLLSGQLVKEYDQIPKKIESHPMETAQLAENTCRNRFRDVVPYEYNRVKLGATPKNRTGYINASHVSMKVKKDTLSYIATQGPLPNTLEDFWQMVVEKKVAIIVMLTALEEQGRVKCASYWPHQAGTPLLIGQYKISQQFSNVSSTCYITSSLQVTHQSNKFEHNVWHIQYTGWPDHGCPEDLTGFLTFLEELGSVRRHVAESSDGPPLLLVHCSAGVGRTGVTILCDALISCLDHNERVDLPDALALLRNQRMLMVQTLAQYKFAYKTLVQYLKNTRLI